MEDIIKTGSRNCLLASLMFSVSMFTYSAESSFGCMIHANELIEIRSPVSGILETVPYKRGQTVVKGAVVATLESSVEISRVALAKHKAETVGTIESGKAKVELLSKKYERRRDLALEKAVPVQERDDADLERRLAEAELKQANEERCTARVEMRLANDELGRRQLRSPINGLVVDQYTFPGEMVDPSDSRKAILKLAQYDPLRVEVVLPIALYGKIKIRDSAEVVPEAPIGGNYRTTVKLVDRVVDAASGTFGIRLEIANPAFTIPPGIKCNIKFPGLTL